MADVNCSPELCAPNPVPVREMVELIGEGASVPLVEAQLDLFLRWPQGEASACFSACWSCRSLSYSMGFRLFAGDASKSADPTGPRIIL